MPRSKRGINSVKLKRFSRYFDHKVVNNKLYVLFYSVVSPTSSKIYRPESKCNKVIYSSFPFKLNFKTLALTILEYLADPALRLFEKFC